MARRVQLVLLILLFGACSATTGSNPVTTAAESASPPTPEPVKTEAVPEKQPVSAEQPASLDQPRDECDGAIIFEHPPVDLDAVEYLVPFGLMTDSHVTPVDHQYFQNFSEPDREIAVYSPGPGRVVSIQHFGALVAEEADRLADDFRLVIEHTCSVSSIFIHIDELIPRLAAHDPGIGSYAGVDVPVEAGELIGMFTANVDYNVVDLSYTTDGLIDATSYEAEPWKIHVPDTFGYFTPELAERMASLSLRAAEPRGGRFTYDIDGRLVGNWFLEGTNGYGGSDPNRYWAGHLTFAYDHLDPSLVVVSIGTFEDRSQQFAVLGNGPDPADVSLESGVVVYELVRWDYLTGSGRRWDRTTFAPDIQAVGDQTVMGVIAVEMVAPRQIQVEVLAGATAADFTGFSPDAQTYTR